MIIYLAARKSSQKKSKKVAEHIMQSVEMSNYLLSLHVHFAARKSSLRNVSESGQPYSAEWQEGNFSYLPMSISATWRGRISRLIYETSKTFFPNWLIIKDENADEACRTCGSNKMERPHI